MCCKTLEHSFLKKHYRGFTFLKSYTEGTMIEVLSDKFIPTLLFAAKETFLLLRSLPFT